MIGSVFKFLFLVTFVLLILLWLNSLGAFADQLSPVYEWLGTVA